MRGLARNFLDGPWPERPGLRYVAYWALRRERLCEPPLCHDRSEDEERCSNCPLDRLEAELQGSAAGQALARAAEWREALVLGLTVTLQDIPADDYSALLILQDERNKWEEEKANGR